MAIKKAIERNNNMPDGTTDKSETRIVTEEELLKLYLSEWSHRDDIMWKQTFRFYIATLFIIVLPYTTQLKDSFSEKISLGICFCAGIAMALVFLYISLAYGCRLKAIADSYKKAINDSSKKLGNMKYRRKDLKGITKCDFLKKLISVIEPSLSITIPTILFISLIIVDLFVYFIFR